MPKIKTNRAAAKRFRTTKTGIIKRSKAYMSHILTTKTRKRKRRLRAVGHGERRRPQEHPEADPVQILGRRRY